MPRGLRELRSRCLPGARRHPGARRRAKPREAECRAADEIGWERCLARPGRSSPKSMPPPSRSRHAGHVTRLRCAWPKPRGRTAPTLRKAGQPPMPDWTLALVEQALRQAAEARRTIDAAECSPATPPLSVVRDAQRWLAWLDPLDAELVRLRCSGSPWKPICWRLSMGRATAHRRWKAALQRIAERAGQSDQAEEVVHGREQVPVRITDTNSCRARNLKSLQE